ncbi:MAG: 3-dehydroquinate synthase [Candidatus Omnitrophota bacterium]
MKKIKVNLGNRSYNVLVGTGIIKSLPAVIQSMGFAGPVVVITDKVVEKKTKHITAPIFKSLPNQVFCLAVPSSEKSKSLNVFKDLVQKISKNTKTHKPLIVAIGGGVVGDLAGFIAATYRRGVPFIQIPTTLLAQVDSSVGGKTGIDLPDAKNLVGAFCQPKTVLMDPDFLKTLPKRQLRNGMAEIIKYGVIGKKGFFEFLEKNIRKILALESKVLEKTIYECVFMKAQVVEKDEFDCKDIRIALNFGHTLGHAVEAAAKYSAYNHGEAISIGMLLAGEIAKRLDMFEDKSQSRIEKLIKKAGLPTKARNVSIKQIMNSYGYDKKFTFGTNRFVLPLKIGKVQVIEDIPGILIRTVLKKYTLS